MQSTRRTLVYNLDRKVYERAWNARDSENANMESLVRSGNPFHSRIYRQKWRLLVTKIGQRRFGVSTSISKCSSVDKVLWHPYIGDSWHILPEVNARQLFHLVAPRIAFNQCTHWQTEEWCKRQLSHDLPVRHWLEAQLLILSFCAALRSDLEGVQDGKL